MDATLASQLTAGLEGASDSMLQYVGIGLVAGIAVVAACMAVKFGIKFFKSIANKG